MIRFNSSSIYDIYKIASFMCCIISFTNVTNILFLEVFIAKQSGIGVALLMVNIVGIYFNRKKYQGIIG
jgi:hypothetical protein